MASKIKRYLSTSLATVLCFIVALTAKLGLIRIFLDIGTDKAALIVTARNLLNGHGVSIDRVSITDLAVKFYEPYIGWPPGYSFILAPFLKFFGSNYMLACYMVECIAAILFLWYAYKLVRLLRFPFWLANLFIVFQGFVINEYISSSHPTDFLAMTFMIAGLFHSAKAYNSNTPARQIFLTMIFFIIASFVRYQYIPVTFLVMILIIIGYSLNRKTIQKRIAVLAFVILNIVFGTLLYYQKMSSGDAFYLPNAGKGFYPENLEHMYPLVVGSFINIDFYAMQLSQQFKTTYVFWIVIARSISIPALIALLIVFSRYVFTRKVFGNNSRDAFWITAGIAAVVLIGMLALLSVFHHSYIGPPMFHWTYVAEGRYYAFPVLVLQIAAWWWLFLPSGKRNTMKIIIRWLIMITIVIEISHGLYFLIKKTIQKPVSFDQILLHQPEMAYTVKYIHQIAKSDPQRKVVVTSLDNQFGYVANLYGASGFFDPLILNSKTPQSSIKTVLLAAIREKELFLFEQYMKNKSVKLVHTTGDYHFYTLYVEPAAHSR